MVAKSGQISVTKKKKWTDIITLMDLVHMIFALISWVALSNKSKGFN